MIALLALLLVPQSGPTTPIQPIVKGTGLAPAEAAEDGEEAVLAPIQRVFGGLERGDAAAIRAELRPGGGATAATPEAIRHYSWDEWLAGIKPGGPRRHEAFVGRPAVEVDGDIAMVWGEYRYTVDGTPHHCGVDHVDLVREGGAWRIQNITWSQRACS